MSASPCPGCHHPVHPLLGAAPLVVEARVVMCCSERCRDEARARLLAGAVAPPAGRAASDPALEVGPQAVDRRRRYLPAWLGLGALLLLGAGALMLTHVVGAEDRADLAGPATTGLAGVLSAPDGPSPARAARPSPSPETPPRPPAPSLMTLKKRSWSELERFLGSETGRYWRTAARVLAEQGHAAALGALKRALGSSSWANRQRAAEALALLGRPEGLQALRRDLGARRRSVKWASAFALARCGDRAGLAIIRQLANYRQHRMTAYEALVRLGDPGGQRYLRQVLTTGRAPYDRLRAAVALGLAGDASGVGLLRTRLGEPGMHMGVALALQKLGLPEARRALGRALDHTALRVEAARALRQYGDVTLVERMAPHLGSTSEDTRLTAAAAIVLLTAGARAEAR